ncbi:Protein of uncharacterised function (DUF1602) [Streptococcus pneumoniae]|nr:Protein of uncharacterised function (DUF1602) [Streptococcus pneumoniae]
MTNRSQISSASPNIWVDNKMVVSFFISSIKFNTSRRPIGSNADTGSSMTISDGLCNNACAIPSRCFIPPENVLTFAFSSSFSPTFSKIFGIDFDNSSFFNPESWPIKVSVSLAVIQWKKLGYCGK